MKNKSIRANVLNSISLDMAIELLRSQQVFMLHYIAKAIIKLVCANTAYLDYELGDLADRIWTLLGSRKRWRRDAGCYHSISQCLAIAQWLLNHRERIILSLSPGLK
jgi:hypothetical protein